MHFHLDLLLISNPAYPSSMLSMSEERAWCYSCDTNTSHEIRYMSEHEFIGKILVCRDCGEKIKQPIGGPGCSDC